MKYNLLKNEIKVERSNPTWIFYILLPLTFLGYYLFRKSCKLDGGLSEVFITIILFIIIFGGFYLLGFVIPRKRFKKNLIGILTIDEKKWNSSNFVISHEEIESVLIHHDFIKRNTFTFDGNNYAWYVSVKLDDLQFAFFIESNNQIESLRRCISKYYQKGLEVTESFGENNLNSFVLFVCENDHEIKKVKEQYIGSVTNIN